MNNCNICKELNYKSALLRDKDYTALVQSGESRIVETENLVVFPSVGPIDSLHVMVVPRIHVHSFGMLSRPVWAETRELLLRLKKFVEEIHSRSLIFFESGAGTQTDHSGGCIVHAHIHAVSVCPEFGKRLQGEIALNQEFVGEPFEQADVKSGYVWFKDESGVESICNRPLLPSQFLRYLYMQSCGLGNMWNWRRHPNIKGVKDVLHNYSGL